MLYAAVALTTAATLIVEISFTRIFSVVFFYHFAFLAISIALFGLGAGGVLSYYLAARGPALYRRLGVLAACNALSVAGALALTLRIAGWDNAFWRLAAVYFCTAAPFVLAGASLSLVIAETIERVGRVYFFDLAGAAAGCLLVIPFLNLMGGPGAILGAGVLYAAASAVWFGMARAWQGRALGVALALALVAVIVLNKSARLLDVDVAKGKVLGQEIFVQWNSFSRVSLSNDGQGRPQIVIDADASTGVPTFDLDHLTAAERAELAARGPGYAYRLRPGAKTLIIGAGGGWDVARALATGSKDVTAVEINPIIAETIMRGRYRALSHNLYFRPEVHVVVEDGRSYTRRTRETFQLIQATLVDTWASTAAGAFALSENSIYTTEAFVDYFSKLTPDGILTFTRWGFDPPRESLRLLTLMREALARVGENEAWRHVIVLREEGDKLKGWGATDTVVVSRKPFPVEELERAAKAAAEGGFEIVYMPGQAPPSPFSTVLTAASLQAFFDSYPYDVRPVSDDRPFFFYTVQPRDAWRFARNASRSSADYKVNLAVPTLFTLLGVSLLATLVTLALPPFLLRARLPRARGVPVFLLYFLCLGAGYVLVQVGMIQRLVLLLGHPTYALTVVIFAMLIWSGVGSFFSARVVRQDDARLMGVLGAAWLLISAMAAAAGLVVDAGSAWPLPLKMLGASVVMAPAAFLMGMAFPSGLARMERWHAPAVKWAWSLNAAASVLGSCGAVFLAIYTGLRNTLLAGGALYLAALAAIWATRREARWKERA